MSEKGAKNFFFGREPERYPVDDYNASGSRETYADYNQRPTGIDEGFTKVLGTPDQEYEARHNAERWAGTAYENQLSNRNMQEQYLADLYRQAHGQGNIQSLSEVRMGQGLEQLQGQAARNTASMSNSPAGLASFLANQQAQQSGNQYNAQMGQQRAQEQLGTEQQYLGGVNSLRGQDLGLLNTQQQLVEQYMAMGLSRQQAQAQARIALEGMKQDLWKFDQSQKQNAWAAREGMLGQQGMKPGTGGYMSPIMATVGSLVGGIAGGGAGAQMGGQMGGAYGSMLTGGVQSAGDEYAT